LAIDLAKESSLQGISTTSTTATSVHQHESLLSPLAPVNDHNEGCSTILNSPTRTSSISDDNMPPSSPTFSVTSDLFVSPSDVTDWSVNSQLCSFKLSNTENEAIPTPKNIIDEQIFKIQRLFAKHQFTWAAQKDTLEIMRELSSFTQKVLPKQGSALMGPSIKHFVDEVPPGELVYFGIEYLLRLCSHLFKSKSKAIRLSVGIDGLPLFRSSNVGV